MRRRPTRAEIEDLGGIAVPFRLPTRLGDLAFITTTVFGTPLDLTLAKLAIEACFPAHKATARALQARAG